MVVGGAGMPIWRNAPCASSTLPTREVAEGAGARCFGRAAAADTSRSGAESVRG